LDYTDPKKIGEQIREFEALLDKLSDGDVVRITVNAHPSTLSDPISPGDKPPLADRKRTQQFENLKTRIGDYLPSWATAENMNAHDLPKILAEAISAAALKALPIAGKPVFSPLSVIRYADGQQMLSVTGVIVNRDDEAKMKRTLGIDEWSFRSTSWTDIHQLVVPHLTVRERLFLERGIINRTPSELMSELGFSMAAEVSIEEFLQSYKSYYRFYPTLLSAEI
jgi:hypothetical protein